MTDAILPDQLALPEAEPTPFERVRATLGQALMLETGGTLTVVEDSDEHVVYGFTVADVPFSLSLNRTP